VRRRQNSDGLTEGESVDIGRLCHKRGWTRAVAKPLISASAYRTIIHTTGVVHGELLIQEYMTSIEDEGECSLVYFAGRFSHALKKLP